jgi:ElaB/YqjD/DUF883 family membrane-anchored ribosome-binding protein
MLKTLDADDVYEQLDSIRSYLKRLSQSWNRGAQRQVGRARHFATDTAEEAEEIMKDHLAASILIALGVGVAIGYLIRRETE